MKTFKIFSLLFVIIGVVTLIACTDVSASEEAYVTVDINPSIELVVSPREKVIYANALNEDAEILLAGLNLVGLDLEDAIDLIIEEALFQGFIDVEDEEINISVSTIANLDQLRERIQARVKANIDNAFEKRAMVGRAVDKVYPQDAIDEAAQHGVNPGFMRLVNSVLLQNDDYTKEELLEMTHQELIGLLKVAQNENRVLMHSLKEEFLLQKEAIQAYYEPLLEELYASLEEEDADIEAIQAEIDALKAQMHEELAVLRSEFVEQTVLLAQQMRLIHNQRRQQHQEHVQEFLDQAQDRRGHMQDRIDEFQNRTRP